MPFQSEKQRRYLWANEPEIARDWTDTYGSRIDKEDGGIADLVEIMAREPAAFGGIMGDDGRRAYGFGSWVKKAFKKATKAVKKIVKSPIGKAALLGAGVYGLGGGSFFGRTLPGLAKSGSFGLGNLKPNAMKYLLGTQGSGGSRVGQNIGKYIPGTKGLIGSFGKVSPMKAIGLASAAPFAMQAMGQWEQPELPNMPGGDQEFDFDYGQMRKDIADAVAGGDYNEFTEVLGNYGLTEGANIPNWGTLAHGAEGGRVNAQEGGLMDLGGMEKDYRDDGGFVPLGGEEKADDVPARLSKNEFVFTADAVRAAGGGDIDKGAQVMENVMKNLEAGGKVSEESQGEGAQDMFEVSERLSEVV